MGLGRLRISEGVFVAATALLPAVADAAPGQFELDWSGPSECPAGDSVRAEVARILHRPIQVPDGTRLEVRCTTERVGDGRLRMNVETREGSHVGKRSVEADTCTELASSAAVLIAILIDPNVVSTGAPGPTTTSDQGEPPVAAPSVDAPVSAPAAASTKMAPSYEGGAMAGVAVGPLPSAAPGLGLRFGVEVSALRLEVGGFA